MKFQVTMKCPDALWEAVKDNTTGGTRGDSEEFNKVMGQCRQWFKYEEMVTLEIDTEANTCTVISCQT